MVENNTSISSRYILRQRDTPPQRFPPRSPRCGSLVHAAVTAGSVPGRAATSEGNRASTQIHSPEHEHTHTNLSDIFRTANTQHTASLSTTHSPLTRHARHLTRPARAAILARAPRATTLLHRSAPSHAIAILAAAATIRPSRFSHTSVHSSVNASVNTAAAGGIACGG